jgi:hypothetical protein
MRLSLCSLLLIAALGSIAVTAAQTPPSKTPPAKPAVWKRYCQPTGGFCFKYPNSWSILGEIFAGHGVVVAPPQTQDRALWNAITVAMVVPPPEGDEEPAGLDGVIEQATSGLREQGQDFETVQRQQRTVDHKPAELLKVRYHEKSNARDWIEEMVFIEGPDNEIYSVALKCSPQDLARLEPAFHQVLISWTLPEPEPPAGAADEASPKPKTTPPAKPH